MPCNTDGGLLSNSHNGMPHGMHTIEVVRQLRGECGARQVPGAKIGLSLAQVAPGRVSGSKAALGRLRGDVDDAGARHLAKGTQGALVADVARGCGVALAAVGGVGLVIVLSVGAVEAAAAAVVRGIRASLCRCRAMEIPSPSDPAGPT